MSDKELLLSALRNLYKAARTYRDHNDQDEDAHNNALYDLYESLDYAREILGQVEGK